MPLHTDAAIVGALVLYLRNSDQPSIALRYVVKRVNEKQCVVSHHIPASLRPDLYNHGDGLSTIPV